MPRLTLPQSWTALTIGLGTKAVAMSGILDVVSTSPHQQRPGLSSKPMFQLWFLILESSMVIWGSPRNPPPPARKAFSLHSQLTPLSSELTLENLRIAKIESVWFASNLVEDHVSKSMKWRSYFPDE